MQLNSRSGKKPPGKSPGIFFLNAELQYRRRLKYLAGKEPAFPVTGKAMGSEGESIRQLEKEMRLLTEERDSLKKRLCVQQKNSLKYRFIKEH